MPHNMAFGGGELALVLLWVVFWLLVGFALIYGAVYLGTRRALREVLGGKGLPMRRSPQEPPQASPGQ